MVRKTYTQVLEELRRETKISGFESRYLGILFGLLGISLPILLTGTGNFSNNFMAGIISIGLVIYAPSIIISLILYYLSGKDLSLKKLSLIISSGAGSFMILFIILASLDYNIQILTKYQPWTVFGFWMLYFIIAIIIWFKASQLIEETFKQ